MALDNFFKLDTDTATGFVIFVPKHRRTFMKPIFFFMKMFYNVVIVHLQYLVLCIYSNILKV